MLDYLAFPKPASRKTLPPTCLGRAEYGLGIAPPPGRQSRRESAGVAGQANRHPFSHLHVGPRPVLQRGRNWRIEGGVKYQYCAFVSVRDRRLYGSSHHDIIIIMAVHWKACYGLYIILAVFRQEIESHAKPLQREVKLHLCIKISIQVWVNANCLCARGHYRLHLSRGGGGRVN